MHYFGVVHKEPKSDYGVSFPDFPGCITAGRTLEEARMMAEEALSTHIELLQEMGQDLPAPSTLDDLRASGELENVVVLLVTIPPKKIVRINVSLPEDVLVIIDRRAKLFHMNRSQFLTEAALHFKENMPSKHV
jgi:predicted RNase H-like HicB family nuclease